MSKRDKTEGKETEGESPTADSPASDDRAGGAPDEPNADAASVATPGAASAATGRSVDSDWDMSWTEQADDPVDTSRPATEVDAAPSPAPDARGDASTASPPMPPRPTTLPLPPEPTDSDAAGTTAGLAPSDAELEDAPSSRSNTASDGVSVALSDSIWAPSPRADSASSIAADSDAALDTDADTGSAPAPGSDADADAAFGSDSGADSDADSDSDADADAASDSDADASTDVPSAAGRASTSQDVPRRSVATPREPRKSISRRFLAAVVVLALVGAGGFLSWRNAQNYYLRCGAETATAERGSFLPAGQTPLEGPAWRPVALSPATRCKTGPLARFDTEDQLREAFIGQLLAEATARVTSTDGDVIDEAEAQLEQAMLLTRSHPGKRELVVQLQGDVEYWRGAARVTAAIEQLEQARAHFAGAAERDARHGTDADKWGDYADQVAGQLRQGPIELRTADVGPEKPPHFTGTETAPAPTDGPTADAPAAFAPGVPFDDDDSEPGADGAATGDAETATTDGNEDASTDVASPPGGDDSNSDDGDAPDAATPRRPAAPPPRPTGGVLL